MPELRAGSGIALSEVAGILKVSGFVMSAKDLGATGGGSADDSTAIQNVINALVAAGGGTLLFPAGSYRINTALTVDADYVLLKGVGAATKLLLGTAAMDGIVFGNGTTSRTFVGVSDMEINVASGVTKTAGSAVRYRKIQSGFTSGLRIANQFLNFRLTDSVLIYSDNDTILNPVATTGGGVLIESTGGPSNDHYFTNLFMQGVQASQPSYGFRITHSGGTWITGGGALYMGDGLVLDAASGVTISNVFAQGWAAFDQCTRNGIKLNAQTGGTIRTVELSQVWSSSNGAEGIIQTGAGTITDIRYVGMEVKNNGKEGLKIDTGSVFHVAGGQYESNSVLTSNTYSGIKIAANLGGFTVRGATSTGAAQKYGLEIATGTSNNYIVSDNDFRTNTTGGLFDGGSGTSKQVYGNLPLSNNELFSIGGGAGIKRVLSATATWDPTSLADGASGATVVGVTGAAVGDPVFVGFSSLTAGNWQISGTVSSADNVTVSLFNKTGGTVDLPSGTLRVTVFKF
jgi:hypothetical protein